MAAFMSRSWTDPHSVQVHVRTDSGILSAFVPQTEHVFELAKNQPAVTIFEPYKSAL